MRPLKNLREALYSEDTSKVTRSYLPDTIYSSKNERKDAVFAATLMGLVSLALGSRIRMVRCSDKEDKIVVVTNSIDRELAGKRIEEIAREHGYSVKFVDAKGFYQNLDKPRIIILGGPKAYEGVGDIVKQLLSRKEQESLLVPGAAKTFVKETRYGGKIFILAGNTRYETDITPLLDEEADNIVAGLEALMGTDPNQPNPNVAYALQQGLPAKVAGELAPLDPQGFKDENKQFVERLREQPDELKEALARAVCKDGVVDPNEFKAIDFMDWVASSMIPDDRKRFFENQELLEWRESLIKGLWNDGRVTDEEIEALNLLKKFPYEKVVGAINSGVFKQGISKDYDGDDVPSLKELQQGTDPTNPLEFDPNDPSELYVVLLNTAGGSAEENLEAYFIVKYRLNVPDDRIVFMMFTSKYTQPWWKSEVLLPGSKVFEDFGEYKPDFKDTEVNKQNFIKVLTEVLPGMVDENDRVIIDYIASGGAIWFSNEDDSKYIDSISFEELARLIDKVPGYKLFINNGCAAAMIYDAWKGNGAKKTAVVASCRKEETVGAPFGPAFFFFLSKGNSIQETVKKTMEWYNSRFNPITPSAKFYDENGNEAPFPELFKITNLAVAVKNKD